MSKVLKSVGLVLTGIIIGVSVALMATAPKTPEVELVAVHSESSEENSIYIEEGEKWYEFSDGTVAIVSDKESKYEFFPVEMGDWSYALDSMEQLEKVMATYLECKNNSNSN